ncbi:MAG: hypothetical protein FD126_1939 [Elusimicrobia bacterium]|nr:MAG: hypothetical protein FD126_1939 [Elusimicrobiota bacterium]
MANAVIRSVSKRGFFRAAGTACAQSASTSPRVAPASRADMSVMSTMGLPSAYISASHRT